MQNVCRFCLNTCDKDAQKISDVDVDIIDFVLPTLDISISKDPVLCTDCQGVLARCFDFKSAYLYTEDFIFKFINLDNDIEERLDMRQLYLKKRNILDNKLPVDQKICRFCMELTQDGTPVSQIDKNILQKCVTTVTLELTEDPVICSSCRDTVTMYSNLIVKCSETDKKIKDCNNKMIFLDNGKQLFSKTNFEHVDLSIGHSPCAVQRIKRILPTDRSSESNKNCFQVQKVLMNPGIKRRLNITCPNSIQKYSIVTSKKRVRSRSIRPAAYTIIS